MLNNMENGEGIGILRLAQHRTPSDSAKIPFVLFIHSQYLFISLILSRINNFPLFFYPNFSPPRVRAKHFLFSRYLPQYN